MNRKLMATALGMFLGMSCAADLAPGLDWQYKGEHKYAKAIAIWTDEGLLKKGEEPEEAVKAARDALITLLMAPDSDISWDEIKTTVSADRGLAKLVWAEADPNKGLQRITHPGYYLFTREGWGFSLLANFDRDGYITEFALNDIGVSEIESRALFTDGITVHEHDLQKYTVPAAAVVNGEPCRTATEMIDALKACEQDEGLCVRTDIILPESRLQHEAVREWIAAQTNHYALAALPAETNGCCRLRAATSPRICRHAVTPAMQDDASTVISINNAVAGFTYRVLEAATLGEPFKPSAIATKVATTDGELAFTIPTGGAPAKFYRIEVISELLP